MPSENRSNIPIGTVLEGKFRITREIGRGGMAAVYEAENVDIGKRVAVKILAAELITSRVVRGRFLREARAAASLRSPYICDVYDSGMYDERPFLVMELLEGESLYDLLSRVRRVQLDVTLRMATHTARGLYKAHNQNIVHRDLKPENIFLTKNEDGELIAKILDFGLAKFYEPTGGTAAQARLTREGALFGTPAYMSPEQAKGQGEVDHRSDLWALGCIVYECLTGQTVWNVEQGVAMILAQIAGAPLPRPTKLRPDLPSSFDTWFANALARNPDERFQDARQFAEALQEALEPDARRPVVSSDSERTSSDPDIASAPRHETPSPVSTQPPPPERPAAGDIPPLASEEPTTERMAMQRGPGRGIAALFLLAAVAVGGYAVWLYVVNSGGASVSDPAKTQQPPPATQRKPVETEPYALQIGSGQEWLRKGKPNHALKMFREAFQTGGSGIARNLVSHTEAITESKGDRCRVTGLGRPRPYGVTAPVSRPSLALTRVGTVVAWVDSHGDRKRRQAFTTLVDESLRRVSEPVLITPEARSVRHPQLIPAGDQLAFIYWDGAGENPGVYVRALQPDGRIKGASRRLSTVKRHDFYPAMVRLDDGHYWAVWGEEIYPTVEDLVGRKLDTDLKPVTGPIRLTALKPTLNMHTAAGRPDVTVAHGELKIAFTLRRGLKHHQIMLLRTPLDEPKLNKGLTPPTRKAARKKFRSKDRFVGTARPISKPDGNHAVPRIRCIEEGCFTVWDDEEGGAFAAFVDQATGETLWRRQLAPDGARPALGVASWGTAVTWYAESRLRLAAMTRDDISEASTLGKVSGLQPYPAIVAGAESGHWYISWRDYEAGHLEALVVRAQCK